MKKKILITIMLTLLPVLMLVSCNPTVDPNPDGDGDDPVDSNTDIDTNITPLDKADAVDISKYSIIYSEDANTRDRLVITNLYQSVNDVCGVYLSRSDDYVSKGEEIPEDAMEIVVGNTNRKEFKDLKYWDFSIVREGKRLYICGGSAAGTSKGISYFIKNYLCADGMLIPDGGYCKSTMEYPTESIKIGGVDIMEYVIVCESDNNDSAYKIQDSIGTQLGVSIEVKNNAGSATKYITYNMESHLTGSFTVKRDGEKIVIGVNYLTVEKASGEFLENLLGSLTNKEYNVTVSYTSKEYDIKSVEAMYTKDQLLQVLETIYNDPDKCIIGEQVEGGRELPSTAIKRFYNATKQNPGILGVDLGVYGLRLVSDGGISESVRRQAILEISDYCRNGGIVTICSHFTNPTNGIDMTTDGSRGAAGNVHTKDAYEKVFKDLITDGTQVNKKFKEELDADAQFLKDLQDNDVTVLWRPFHELNGTWFWWCVTQKKSGSSNITINPESIKNLWRYVYNYYTKDWGLTNLIWVYSPNASSNIDNKLGLGKTTCTKYCYPGDAYVDMVGTDWYKGEDDPEPLGYNEMVDMSNKMGALTEVGLRGNLLHDKVDNPTPQDQLFNAMDLLDNLLQLRDEGYKFTYTLLWSGGYSIESLGKGIAFMSNSYTLGQADVYAMFRRLK